MKNTHQFTKISQTLTKTSQTYKLDTALLRYKILKYWESTVTEIVSGAEEATKAIDFKKGILTVACLSQEIAYQIKVLSSRIIYALNQILGSQQIFAIRVEC